MTDPVIRYRALDPGTVAAVRAALNEHKALVFRGVDLEDEGQQRFAGYYEREGKSS